MCPRRRHRRQLPLSRTMDIRSDADFFVNSAQLANECSSVGHKEHFVSFFLVPLQYRLRTVLAGQLWLNECDDWADSVMFCRPCFRSCFASGIESDFLERFMPASNLPCLITISPVTIECNQSMKSFRVRYSGLNCTLFLPYFFRVLLAVSRLLMQNFLEFPASDIFFREPYSV